MAKKKSGFDKFGGSTSTVDPEEPVKTNQDDDNDEAEIQEPTDEEPTVPEPEESIPPLGTGQVPAGAYRKLCAESMKATTAAEQEQILARMHPNNSQLPDPALNYQRALTMGRTLPEFKARADADPLMLKSKDLFERIIAGGLVIPGAYTVYNLIVDHLTELLANLAEKPNAESGQGSAGGNAALGS